MSILEATGRAIGQACAAIDELRRLETLDKEWNWSEVAVVAKEWSYLEPVRARTVSILVFRRRGGTRIRRTSGGCARPQALVAWVREPAQKLLDGAKLTRWLTGRPRGPVVGPAA